MGQEKLDAGEKSACFFKKAVTGIVFLADDLDELCYQVRVPLAPILFPFKDGQCNLLAHAGSVNPVACHGIPGVCNSNYTS